MLPDAGTAEAGGGFGTSELGANERQKTDKGPCLQVTTCTT